MTIISHSNSGRMTACSHTKLATYTLVLKSKFRTLHARNCVQGGAPPGDRCHGVRVKILVAMHASHRINTMKGLKMHLQTSLTFARSKLSKGS